MTSPTVNSVGITTFNPFLTGTGRFLAQGTKWGGALGTGVTLDFSFRGANSHYATNYSSAQEYLNSALLSSGEMAAVRLGLRVWSNVTNLNFHEVTDSFNVAGDLRFGYVKQGTTGEAAHAYYPWTDPAATECRCSSTTRSPAPWRRVR